MNQTVFVYQFIAVICVVSGHTSFYGKDQQQERYGRIVGGSDAIRGSVPYIASLTRRGGHFCGAAIVNSRWLLTAAHCVCNGFNEIHRPGLIKAVLGLHKISEFRKQNTIDVTNSTYDVDDVHRSKAYDIGFKKIVVHPKYDCNSPDNDIALLEFSKPITFSNTVKPIKLAVTNSNNNNTYNGETALISGWGYTHEDYDIGTRADVLQNAKVTIWSNEQCQESFRQQKKSQVIKPSQMCAGRMNGGVDSCWADSGGPMVSKDDILIGVVSTGIGCARPGLPGIYTRVTEYAEWIKEILATDLAK